MEEEEEGGGGGERELKKKRKSDTHQKWSDVVELTWQRSVWLFSAFWIFWRLRRDIKPRTHYPNIYFFSDLSFFQGALNQNCADQKCFK